MPKIIPIGPPTKNVGKTLWEIVGNLKNCGVGRYVKRNIYERYPEPTYYRILKVEAMPVPEDKRDLRKVRAYTEKVFRGRKSELMFEMCHETQSPDFVLVPNEEEKSLLEKVEAAAAKLTIRTMPSSISFPPLLKEFIMQERISKGLPTDEEPRLKLIIQQNDDKLMYRYAKDGETPSVPYNGGKGQPVSPELYEIPEFYKEMLTKEHPPAS